MKTTNKTLSDRILVTPSPYAKTNYLYVQEVGTHINAAPHVNTRNDLCSFLFLIVITGHGRIMNNGQSFFLKQGDCAWIDCRCPYSHESSPDAPWQLKWVHFYGECAPSFYSHFLSQELPAIFTPENPAIFNECLSGLLVLQKSKEPFKELLSHKYLTDIIAFCFTESIKRLSFTHPVKEKLKQIQEYIHGNFAEKITLEDLSGMFYISKYHMVREYKKIFGITPGNELSNCRISHAKALLRFGSQSVEEIAVLCGFQNSAYFIRVFKKTENMTPLEYRRKW